MFDLNIRFQIAAILIFAILIVDFIRNKKLSLLSTKYFMMLLIFSGINLIFDIITVYTISNLDVVPACLNRLCHQIFIASLNLLIMFLFFYIDALCKKQGRLRFNWILLLQFIPFVISMVMVVVGPLKYHVGPDAVYSYGLMAYTVYASVGFYMGTSIYKVIKYRKSFSFENFITIILGISLWIGTAIIQMIWPKYLLSGLALVGMLVVLYFSYENPKEHMDDETESFNKRAFSILMSELVNSKRNYTVINIVIEDLTSINRTYGYEKGISVLAEICQHLKVYHKRQIFHTRGNIISYVVLDENEVEADVQLLKNFLDHSITIYNNIFKTVKKNIRNGREITFVQPVKEKIEEIPVCAHIDIIKKENICPQSLNRILSVNNFMADILYGRENDTPITTFDTSLMKQEERKNSLLELVTRGITENGFEMVYQPIFSTKDNKFSSAEALVRLKDKKTIGFVSPEEFIPIAEKFGLISELSDLIFEMVCKFISENDLEKLGVKYIEINLSAIQCVDTSLPSHLASVLNKYKVPSKFINLEITETALVESDEKLKVNMEALRALGCTFAMDDFGTGYSNLSKIADVTYDLIKLDKSLIWPCFGENKSDKARAILSNVMNMLYDLNTEIVAEGVETKEQLDYLLAHNVTHIQGFYFSKPLGENDYLEYIKKNNC